MYAASNREAAAVEELLETEFDRIMVHVPVTAYSFYDAILYQISRDQNKYKNIEFMQQIAFYMAKWPNRVMDIVKPFLGNQSYESYIKNIFHGTKFIDVEVIVGVVARMWNLCIVIVYPQDGSVPFYFSEGPPDIIIVCNSMAQPETYYCATKGSEKKWRPLKPADWSNTIQVFNNVKNAFTIGEKRLRERLVTKAVDDFNSVNSTLESMNETINKQQVELASMAEKLEACTSNAKKMAMYQNSLREKLTELGVDVNKLSKTGVAVEGIHYTAKRLTDSVASNQVTADIHPTPSTPPMHKVPTATISKPPVSDETPDEIPSDDSALTPATSTPALVGQDQVVSSTPQGIVTPVVQSITTPVVSAVQGVTGGVVPTPQTVTTQMSTIGGVQLPQIVTPGGSALGGVQQIVNIAGQNVLVSGSGPSTVGTVSIRYGKVLKGVHKFFCQLCGHPFTGKSDLSRHLRENCPMVEQKDKVRFKCVNCEETFSSKQYMNEHNHEIHLQTFYCHCKSCGKGFYKHCKLNHHKKSCLAFLCPSKNTGSSTVSDGSLGGPLIGGETNFTFSAPIPQDKDNDAESTGSE